MTDFSTLPFFSVLFANPHANKVTAQPQFSNLSASWPMAPSIQNNHAVAFEQSAAVDPDGAYAYDDDDKMSDDDYYCKAAPLGDDELEDAVPKSFRKLFSDWDVDENGSLDLDEVVEGLKGLYESQELAAFDESTIESLFHSVDQDQNEVLDRHEFQQLLDEVAEQLGIEKEDLSVIANAARKDKTRRKSELTSAILPRRNRLQILFEAFRACKQTCTEMTKLQQERSRAIMKDAISSVAMQKRKAGLRRERCNITMRSAGLRKERSNISMRSTRRARSSRTDMTCTDDSEFVEDLEDVSEAMWIPMEELSLHAKTNPEAPVQN